jgi:Ca2+-binding RTX toxin-like protein
VTHGQRSRLRALALLGGLLAAIAVTAVTRLDEPAAAAPTELFVSEYVEGSGNNKAVELYNGTGSPVTLTESYDVQIFANGSAVATATIPLAGTVADADVFVLARATAVAAILAEADQTSTNFLWNGNDAVALRRDGAIVDVVGQIGVDPGTEWGTGDASTADNTMRRKPTVQAGDPNGADTFDPALQWDGFAVDTFSGLGAHTVSGGGGGGGGGEGNRAPAASPDAVALEEDEAETPIDVLANDTDPDGDSLTVVSTTDAASGTVTVASGGATVSYTPDVDFSGSDSFTYTVTDGRGGLATATVSVTVDPANDDPDVEDDAATTPEDTPVAIDVLTNDEEPEGAALTISDVSGAEHGTPVIGNAGTAIVYEPDPDFNGTDVVEYTVTDGADGVEAGEITVTVTAVNDPPVARGDSAAVAAGGSVVLAVVANDAPGPANESGQALAVSSVGQAGHGSAELVTGGSDAGKVRYTPASGFTGSDTFAYTISDGEATSTGSVSIQVRRLVNGSMCGLTATIQGTPASDVLSGTPGDDVIRAGRGNDTIDGNGGHDIVCGGPGADRISTAEGADRIAGGSGSDTISSGSANDRVRGGFGRDEISTGAGGDSIAAGGGSDLVDGGDGANAVAGGADDDTLRAGAGDDRLDGGPGTDTCEPGAGRNTLVRCE